MRDYICVHRPVTDEHGVMVDCELVVWNAAYENVRTKKPVRGQLMSETYFLPEGAIAHAVTAWNSGRSYQVFEMAAGSGDRYRPDDTSVAIEVQWMRARDFVIEIGSDLSEFQQVQKMLRQQELDAAHVEHAARISEERERIARDLHDSVIQNLFAVSLSIRNIARQLESDNAVEALTAIGAMVAAIIDEIRLEIFDVRDETERTILEDITAIIEPICHTQGVNVTVHADDIELDIRMRTNLRAVLREGMSNAVRHGKPENITVSVRAENGILTMEMTNDGESLPTVRGQQSGTLNMAKRAELLGGVMSLRNTDDGNVRLLWRVPMTGDGS